MGTERWWVSCRRRKLAVLVWGSDYPEFRSGHKSMTGLECGCMMNWQPEQWTLSVQGFSSPHYTMAIARPDTDAVVSDNRKFQGGVGRAPACGLRWWPHAPPSIPSVSYIQTRVPNWQGGAVPTLRRDWSPQHRPERAGRRGTQADSYLNERNPDGACKCYQQG